MKHVVMFSGGIGSWAAGKLVAKNYPKDDITLLFTDVKGNNPSPHVGEDEDTYRFIQEAADNIGAKLIILNKGLDIWEVFKKERFLGNSRLAKCSHELKQKPARAWIDEHCDPEKTVIYVGIDWTETHRVASITRNYLPFIVKTPLTEEPYYDKKQLIKWAESEGLRAPRLYAMGFSHNNCGGGCVRAGQGQFKHLLDVMPDRFAVWEEKEKEIQQHLQKDVTILSEVINGVKHPLPLSELRKRSEESPMLIDTDDIGGCGCFMEEVE